jgi:hypothetical protein
VTRENRRKKVFAETVAFVLAIAIVIVVIWLTGLYEKIKESPWTAAFCLALFFAAALRQYVFNSGLESAIERGDETAVIRIMQRASRSSDAANERFGWGRDTALHLAVRGNKVSIASVLISYGADVNAVDDDGWTPLDYSKSSEVSSVLQSAGARRGAGQKEKHC